MEAIFAAVGLTAVVDFVLRGMLVAIACALMFKPAWIGKQLIKML